MKNNFLNILTFIALLALSTALLPAGRARADLYIDIVSSPRKIPIAIQELAGPGGNTISDIVSYDLEFSGLFSPIDRKAFLERAEQPFSRGNWTGIGAEAVVKGFVTQAEGVINATVYLYDTFEGTTILRKSYRTRTDLIRPLAHSIAGDIYEKITGQAAVFRAKIAFVRRDHGLPELYLMDWDGQRATGLNIKGSILLSPRWSPDGSKLLYSAERKRSWGVYILDFEKRKEVLAYESKGTNIGGSFLPGGEEFVLSSSRNGTPDIYIYRSAGSKLTRLTRDRGIEVSPAVNPDGKTIAFVSDLGGTPQIYSMDKLGYNKTRITYEGNYNTSPTWSPKGDMLTFSGSYNGRHQIYIVKPDGTGLKRLTDEGNNETPTFSPDGRFIAFTSDRDGGKAIYVMRANGEALRRITPRGMVASDPSWSPK